MSPTQPGASRPSRITVRLFVLFLVSSLLSVGVAGPAAATHELMNASNLLAITEVGLDVASSPAVHELSANDRALLDGATKSPTVNSRWRARGGALATVVNTVSTLGEFAMLWDGPAEEVPRPPAEEGVAFTGSASCGWTSIPGATVSCTSTHLSIYLPANQRPAGSTGSQIYGYLTTTPNTCSAFSSSGTDTMRINRPAQGGAAWTFTHAHYSANSTNCLSGWGGPTYDVVIAPQGGTADDPSTAGVPEDPAEIPHYFDSTGQCRASGGTPHEITATYGPFYFDPANPTYTPNIPALSCPPGEVLTEADVVMRTPGADTIPVHSYAAPPWVERQIDRFPNCWPAATTKCQLELVKIGVGTDPDYDCNEADTEGNLCRSWWTDPDRSEKYACKFGGELVALRLCEPYKDLFKPDPKIAPTAPEVQENPDTPPDPAPPRDPEIDPTPEQTPGLTNCAPSWVQLLTPWWVFKAGACVLSWAFVPDGDAIAGEVDRLQTALAETTPGVWISALDFPTAYTDSGCLGPLVTIPDVGVLPQSYSFRPFSACDEPMATVAAIGKFIASCFVVVGGTFACVRILSASLGLNLDVGRST